MELLNEIIYFLKYSDSFSISVRLLFFFFSAVGIFAHLKFESVTTVSDMAHSLLS